jgi:hypothetical protein
MQSQNSNRSVQGAIFAQEPGAVRKLGLLLSGRCHG